MLLVLFCNTNSHYTLSYTERQWIASSGLYFTLLFAKLLVETRQVTDLELGECDI